MITKIRVRLLGWAFLFVTIVLVLFFIGYEHKAGNDAAEVHPGYEYEETRQLVSLVNDAAGQVHAKGVAAFDEFRVSGSRWRQGETYVFVLDPEGNMLVHPDAKLEGKNVLGLEDINGRKLIRGIIGSATAAPGKPEGWYHYEWPVPGGLFPRWKSTYARLAIAPSGKNYIVAAGMYNDRMERSFVVDAVKDAVARIERDGKAAFHLFHDPAGPFVFKDAYIFVFDSKGSELVNPAFPNLEGRNLLEMKDAEGKPLVREMLRVAQRKGAGWVNYMWPKPGEATPSEKTAYVSKAKMGDQWVVVGCGVYLAGAPKAAQPLQKMTAPELMALVRDAAATFSSQGEKAYPEFRRKGSRWFHDGTYFFVWSMDGTRVFHAAHPEGVGRNVSEAQDVLGRPWGRMMLQAAASPSGEGWVHYMYPEPGNIFPTWKSSFVKRVTFPSGKQYLIGCGIYNMQMGKAFIEDVVNRAAALVAADGSDAFPRLRDKRGPFVFMDTYVFVFAPNGVELVNPAQPSLEGRDISDLKDIKGKPLTRICIDAAMKNGSDWVEYYWYKPGENTPARKESFVKKVQSGKNVYVVGSGYYVEE